MLQNGRKWEEVVNLGMQQVVRFLIDLKDKQRIEEEANKLGLKTSGFLRLLVKLYQQV